MLDLDAASDADGTHQPAADLGESCDTEKLKKEIDEQGGKVRALKAEKADKVKHSIQIQHASFHILL